MITVKLSVKDLRDHDACDEGVEWFKKNVLKGKKSASVVWTPEEQLKFSKTPFYPWAQDVGLIPRLDITNMTLKRRNLDEVHLLGGRVVHVDFLRSSLRQCNFNRAQLVMCRFEDCDLEQSSFYGTSARHTNFRGSNLNSVYFVGADLTGANFSGANLRGASLREADLDGANFGGALNVPPLDEKWIVSETGFVSRRSYR